MDFSGFTKPRQPILGIVLAGEVESVGKDVDLFKKVTSIWLGPFSRFWHVCRVQMYAEKGMLAIKPTNVNYEEAAAFLWRTLALHILEKEISKSRQKFLFMGLPERSVLLPYSLQVLRGGSNRGMQYTNLELVKISGSRYS